MNTQFQGESIRASTGLQLYLLFEAVPFTAYLYRVGGLKRLARGCAQQWSVEPTRLFSPLLVSLENFYRNFLGGRRGERYVMELIQFGIVAALTIVVCAITAVVTASAGWIVFAGATVYHIGLFGYAWKEHREAVARSAHTPPRAVPAG